MLASALRFEMKTAVYLVDRSQLEQWDFERTLDQRAAIQRGLKLAQKYRRFYRANCNLSTIYKIAHEAASNFHTSAVLYEGLDPIKSQILFRWLRNEAEWHDLEVSWKKNGVITVSW